MIESLAIICVLFNITSTLLGFKFSYAFLALFGYLTIYRSNKLLRLMCCINVIFVLFSDFSNGCFDLCLVTSFIYSLTMLIIVILRVCVPTISDKNSWFTAQYCEEFIYTEAPLSVKLYQITNRISPTIMYSLWFVSFVCNTHDMKFRLCYRTSLTVVMRRVSGSQYDSDNLVMHLFSEGFVGELGVVFQDGNYFCDFSTYLESVRRGVNSRPVRCRRAQATLAA